jgi:hypothetical protein
MALPVAPPGDVIARLLTTEVDCAPHDNRLKVESEPVLRRLIPSCFASNYGK